LTIFILFIYTIAYAFIIFKPHISSVTTLLFGIVSILLLGEFNFENLPAIVDFNTLFILLGMMLTISILKSMAYSTKYPRGSLNSARGI